LAIGTLRSRSTRTAWSSGAARPARTATFRLWRHGIFRIDLGYSDHQGAFVTFASDHDFAVFTAFERSFKAVETQAALLALLAMATEAGGFKEWFDVLRIGHTFLFGGRRKFGDV
jgi:hypothetical protein